VKRLESFPNFKNLIKRNSLEKELNRLKTNIDLKLKLLCRENLDLLYLEGPDVDQMLLSKFKMIYYQG